MRTIGKSLETYLKFGEISQKYKGIILSTSLKVPERYENCLRVSSSVKGKSLSTPPSGRNWATSQTAKIGPNESRNKNSPSTNCQKSSRRADEQVEVRTTYYPQDKKLSLKADEPQVGQRYEDVELPHYYFPERSSNFTL